MHVAVLKGGLSSEREVSLSSAKGVAEALNSLGHKVTEVDVGFDVSEVLLKLKPDVVFNALHGTYGEDGCIQGVLEFLQIPYTHSGVMASAAAMHKPTAKILFEAVGIKCPEGDIFSREDILSGDVMPRPYVIKPIGDGSSVGVIIVREDTEFVEDDLTDCNNFLVEKFIDGKELTVGVLNSKAMGVIEIVPKAGFYDYKNKYTAGMTDYLLPAPIDKDMYDMAMDWGERADKVLCCRGISRSDFILSDSGELIMLETNTHPGLTPTSLVPKLAESTGMSFENLIDSLLGVATLDNK